MLTGRHLGSRASARAFASPAGAPERGNAQRVPRLVVARFIITSLRATPRALAGSDARHSNSTSRTELISRAVPLRSITQPLQVGGMNGAGGSGHSHAQQDELVCNDCRTLLRYPRGAAHVRCPVCTRVSAVGQQPQPEGQQRVAHLICGGCRTMLCYPEGASSVRCSVCQTVNLLMQGSSVANITCGGCNTHLLYQTGASCVKCALCDFVTQISGHAPPHAPGGDPSGTQSYGGDQYKRQDSVDRNPLIVIQNPSEPGQEAFAMSVGRLCDV